MTRANTKWPVLFSSVLSIGFAAPVIASPMTESPITIRMPEPLTLSLFGLGLIGLVGLRALYGRKRDK
jgi:hypothetical protein